MSSKMEQIIEEIEEYIDGCKFQPLSSTKIIVNKEELEELIGELRENTPEEIKKGHTKDKNYELNLQNNKIGLFTVDPYNFGLTVIKLGNDLYRRSDLNKDEYLKISYELINILLNM